uniref:HMA domain-containing protein n=1 Tax=mine drainage metagenome TaxID=410659 RepID=E6QK25_9ZZZZ
MAEVNLRVEGMHCGACVRRVTQTIASAGPYTVEEVRLGAARFVAEDTATAVDVVVAALGKAGFTAHAEA